MKNKVLAFLAAGLFAAPTHAAMVVTITQVGSDVKVEGSGTLNVTGLGSPGDLSVSAQIKAGILGENPQSYVSVGPTASTNITWYSIFASPFVLGNGTAQVASQGSGSAFGIYSPPTGSIVYLGVPAFYASGSSLSGESTYLGKTIAGLGLTNGTYVWNWGSGASADSFTLRIGETTTVPPVPLPAAAWLLLSGLAGLGVVARRKRSDAA